MVGWIVLLNICDRNISFQKERQANHLWQDQPHREDSFRQINATWCTNLISLGIFVPDLFDQTCVFLLTQCPLSGLVKASGSNGNHQGRYASLLCTFPSINAIAVLIQKVKVGNNFWYLKTSELAQKYSSAIWLLIRQCWYFGNWTNREEVILKGLSR